MQRIFSITSFLFLSLFAFAQNPVHWTFEAKSLGNNEYNLIASAKIDEGWTTYSQYLESEDGPVRTAFEFKKGAYEKIGKVEESGGKKTAFDKVFGMNLTKFYHDAIFTQKVKVSDITKPITGYVQYMACDNSMCLPPKDFDFSFKLPASSGSPSTGAVTPAPTTTTKVATTTTAVVVPPTTKQLPATTTPAPSNTAQPVVTTTTTTAAPTKENPVQWAFSSKKISDTEYDLIYTGALAKGWYTYSQYTKEGGPVPTSIEYNQDANYELVGKCTESDNKIKVFDKTFGVEVLKFKDNVTFTQRIKVKDAGKSVKGYVTFMCCNDQTCLPPKDVNFDIALGAPNVIANIPTLDDPDAQGIFDSKRDINSKEVIQACGAQVEENTSLWWVFVGGFIGGLLALLTPCVFPMIPLTVSFFTKRSPDRKTGIRNAIIYGLSIIVIYVAIGTILTSIFGATILNEMSTDMYFNILFFVIFVVFAISFFGYYEITLPEKWVNKSDQAADRGGLLGIFFMAFTLALVSFSCTGPIIGSLLVQTAQGATETWGRIPIRPVLGMFGFSFALALPFALFAIFPSWLNSLPKSGGWMNNVKVTLGFIELILAFKFLSTADLVRHWEILKLELFLAIWIVLTLALAAYQFGFIRFPHDDDPRKIKAGNWIVGGLALLFAGYLCTGYTYEPLKLLSGLAPPTHYNFFRPMDCPHNIDCYKDFDEALKVAKEKNKPLFVDFTGYGCVNCRKMEENVWVKPEILKYLKEDYVVVSLYVDDQKRLFPDDKQKYLLDKHTGEKLRTVGSKWASFQINNFGVSAQPYYVLMANDGKTLLTNPVPFTPNVTEYKAFLDCGLEGFKKGK
ncbi:MAG: hypothetical protein RLZZ292_2558 [Bacteroidota bacterium]|jgi:thiol:disulfide interchange protein DsbD